MDAAAVAVLNPCRGAAWFNRHRCIHVRFGNGGSFGIEICRAASGDRYIYRNCPVALKRYRDPPSQLCLSVVVFLSSADSICFTIRSKSLSKYRSCIMRIPFPRPAEYSGPIASGTPPNVFPSLPWSWVFFALPEARPCRDRQRRCAASGRARTRRDSSLQLRHRIDGLFRGAHLPNGSNPCFLFDDRRGQQ